MAEKTLPLRGIVIPDPGFVAGALGTSSSYTQAGPLPGTPEASSDSTTLRIEATGAQSAAVDVLVRTSGYPSARYGPGVVVKLATEATTEYRTWNEPAALSGTSVLATDVTLTNPTARPPQAIRVPWLDTVCVAFNGSFYTYDWTDNTWAAVVVVATSSTLRSCAVCTLPGSRLLYIADSFDGSNSSQESYISADDGATWTLVSDVVCLTQHDASSLRSELHYHAQSQTILYRTGGYQYASSDGGVSFDVVDSTTQEMQSAIAPDGTVWSVWEDGSGLQIGRTSSPYTVIRTTSEVTEIVTGTGTVRFGIWVDEDGLPHVWFDNTAGAISLMPDTSVRTTYDYGETWSARGSFVLTDFEATYATAPHSSVMCRGTLFAVGVGYDGSAYPLLALAFGGWSNIQDGRLNASPNFVQGTWSAPREFDADTTPGTYADDYYIVSTSSSEERWPGKGFGGSPVTLESFDTGVALDVVEILVDLEPVSGGAATTTVRGAVLAISDTTDYREIELQIGTSSYGVYDTVASAALTGTTSFTSSTRVQIRVRIEMSTGLVETAYRELDTLHAQWVVGMTGTATSTTGTRQGYKAGHITSGTAVTHWYGIVPRAGWSGNTRGTYSDDYTTWMGRRLSTYPYPCPVTDGLYLSAQSGPGYSGEVFSVPVDYTYGISNALAIESPSHAEAWRSTDTTEQRISIDLTYQRIVGRSVALLLRHCNAGDVRLEGRNGGAGAWTEIAEYAPTISYDFAMTALSGEVIAAGTDTGLRYIRENELAGAWIDLGSSKYRRIASNTAGSLNGAAGRKAIIRLESPDGTEPTSGTATIYPHTGLLIVRSATLHQYREWSLRIPAGSTPEGYWTIGAALVGSYQPIGLQPSHGWSHKRQSNVREVRTPRGVAHRDQRGPNQTVWTWSYQDPHDETGLTDGDDPDWVNNASGPDDYLATYRDVYSQLVGVLDKLQGGALPCVVVAADVSATTTLTDPEAFLYAFLSGDIQRNNIWGNELEDGIYRVESLTAEEIVG